MAKKKQTEWFFRCGVCLKRLRATKPDGLQEVAMEHGLSAHKGLMPVWTHDGQKLVPYC